VRVGVPHISSIGTIEIVRFVPGARVKAGRIRVTERPMSNVNYHRITASRTAIGAGSAIDLKHARRMALLPRIRCVIGGKGRQRRNDHARRDYCKAKKRSRHDLNPLIADDIRPSNPDEQPVTLFPKSGRPACTDRRWPRCANSAPWI
jgi:hypothetical protein